MKTATVLCLFLALVTLARGESKEIHFIKDNASTALLFSSEAEDPRQLNEDAGRVPMEASSTLHPLTCLTENSCGDGLCCCSRKTASCISQGLSYIPILPPEIRQLNFFNNSLGQVDNATLQNVTSLVVLNLEKNKVSFIHPEAFVRMTKLRTLALSINNLTDLDQLVSALAHAPSLKYLNASCNQFMKLSLGNLSAISKLKELRLRENKITEIVKRKWKGESRLELLDLGVNNLPSFPDFCHDNTSQNSFLPHLHSFNIEWNLITVMHPDSAKCLPGLRNLNLGGNAIRHIRENFLHGIPSLESLSLQFCMSKIIDSHAFNHTNLRYLNVSENLWFFDSHYGSGINPGLFRNVPHLQLINMSWTVFRFSKLDERRAVLSSVRHVKEFLLQGSGLNVIPETILTNFTNLTSLSFSKNEIAYLPDKTFENLTALRTLDLHLNHLTSVSQQLLEDILSRDNATVDLGDNPFSCTCDLLWFIQRYKEDTEGKMFVGRPYICYGPDSVRGQSLDKVEITRSTCMIAYNTYIAILFVCGFSLVLLIVGAFGYK